jgi:hypothetical protein
MAAPVMIGWRRVASGTAAASIVSTALSAISNFCFSSSAARCAGAAEFGRLALCLAILSAGLYLSRGALGQAMLIRPADADRAVPISIGFGTFIAAAIFVTAVTTGLSQMTAIPFAFGAGLTFLQDALRYAHFARGDARGAAWMDLTWAAVTLPAVAVPLLPMPDVDRLPLVVSLWALGAAASTIHGMTRLRGVRLLSADGWLGQHAGLVRPLATEAGAFSLAGFALYPLLGASCGSTCVAGYRGGEILAAPAALLVIGLLNVLPHALATTANRRATVRNYSAYVVLLEGAWLGVLLLGGGPLAHLVLGASGSLAFRAGPFLVLNALVAGLASVASMLLKMRGAASVSARIRGSVAPLQPIAAGVGGGFSLIAGCAAAVGAQVISLGLLVNGLRRVSRSKPSAHAPSVAARVAA